MTLYAQSNDIRIISVSYFYQTLFCKGQIYVPLLVRGDPSNCDYTVTVTQLAADVVLLLLFWDGHTLNE